MFAMMCTTASAATEDEIEQSIIEGLAWLAPQQLGDGSWNNNPGITGLVLLKFIDRAKELGYDDPEDPNYEYSQNVKDGLTYLDSKLITVGVGTGYDGNNNGNMTNLGGTYYTGIAAMAYSANPGTDPDLVQDLTDWLVNAQCTDDTAAQNGVWGYSGFSCYGDNSNTGYATLGLGFAINAGATIPDSTKTALSSYVDYIQNDPGNTDDGTEDDPDGGSGYSGPSYWVNSLKTGNLIYEAVLSGDEPDSARILDAVDYIYRHWNDDIEGWLGGSYPLYTPYNTQYQATFAIMKGLESIVLEDLNGTDWFDEMSTVIVNDQALDGRWTGCPAYVRPSGNPSYLQSDELCTAWALLTLEKVIPNRPPDVSEANPSIDCLWPPNHKFVDIAIEGVTDPDGDEVTITITGITSDEPTDSIDGAGDDAPDASGVGTDTASLRAERSGTGETGKGNMEFGNGRVYEITFVASDGQGGETTGSVFVKVPHDQKGDCLSIDDGQDYDATLIN